MALDYPQNCAARHGQGLHYIRFRLSPRSRAQTNQSLTSREIAKATANPLESAKFGYLAGGFNAGGRKPSCAQAGNWITDDQAGRTFYVGKRRNGKLLRVYEKGKQLGMASSPWTRWEVELHNIDRVIPWEVIADPARYIAGAYPALAWVSALGSRIPTLQRCDSITYKRIIFYARLGYGRLIDTMMSREGCDEETVVRLLRRPGVPGRLALTEALGIHSRATDEEKCDERSMA